MFEQKPTYDIADALIAKFVRPIEIGDLAQPFEARDQDGRLLNLSDDHLSGKHLVLVFLNNPQQDSASGVLKALAGQWQDFEDKAAAVLAIHSNSNAATSQKLKLVSGFSWPILGDPGGTIHAKYGLHKNHGVSIRIVLLSRFRQIRSWWDNPVNINSALRDIMAQLTTPHLPGNEQWYPMHAPVLLVPNVFTREECKRIVESYEGSENFRIARERAPHTDEDFKLPVYEHNRQDRIDHVIHNKPMTQFLDQRVGERVNPMIKKAFAFEVTRREDFHIARYVGKREGIHMGHRDNTSSATAYRRFAFSMNLNEGYDGGGIVFREFNDHPYRPEPGTVLIFSSSLLHEVEETTRGVRYSLITHLFNDTTVNQAQRSSADVQ